MSRTLKPMELASLIAFELLSGSGWLFTSIWPRNVSFVFAELLHFALLTAVAALFSLCRGRCHGQWLSRRCAFELALVGICLYALPILLVELASNRVSQLTTVSIFAGVPVVTALGAAAVGNDTVVVRTLPPALLGWFGALLIFPVALPSTTRAGCSYALVIAAALLFSVGGVWLNQLLTKVDFSLALCMVGLSNVIVFAIVAKWCGSFTGVTLSQVLLETLRGAVYDLPLVWLTIWLLRRLDAIRLSSRTLIGPAVTIMEGYLLIRDWPPLRTATATAILLIGGIWLLRGVREGSSQSLFCAIDPEESSLRH